MAEDKVVLVGVDGSPESLGAVDWAVARAARSGWCVHILCAYSLPSFTTASFDGGYVALNDTAIRSGTQAVVDEAVTRAQGKGVIVTSSLETGDIRKKPRRVRRKQHHDHNMNANHHKQKSHRHINPPDSN